MEQNLVNIPSWLKGKYVESSAPRKNVLSCPWCQSKSRKEWGKPIRGFVSQECLSCGLVYVSNPLSDEAQGIYYQFYPQLVHQLKDEERNEEERGRSTIANRKIMYEIEVNSILSSHKKYLRGEKNLKILDVGCAGGHFLDYFLKKGLKTFGIDLIDQEESKHKLFKGSFPDYKFQEKFDLITFRGVVEHLSNPIDFLDKSIDLLEDEESIIAITSTPNLSSPSAEYFKERWTLHGPEAHILHFKTEHFHNFFGDKNFRCVKESYPYLQSPYSSFISDLEVFADHLNFKEKYKQSPPFFESMMTVCYERY